MGKYLADVVYSDGIKQIVQTKFGGYNRRDSAGNGDIVDMLNMTSDRFPLLSTKKCNRIDGAVNMTAPNGITGHNALAWVDGTEFYYDGAEKGTVTNDKKTFAWLGDICVILPDKKYYNAKTDTFGSLGAKVENQSVQIKDGTYAGVEAKANTIYKAGFDWSAIFRVGDAVTITGATDPHNNRTPVIREIEGAEMRFYEFTFDIGAATSLDQTLTIERQIPDLDFICENENRLWGCKGDTIYASALGNPFVWYDYEGLSTGSFAVDVGSAGSFTGCYSYLGYPIFFKENHIYKAYGTKPSNFQLMGSATLGVKDGCSKSLAVAGETLFYYSPQGICAYTGGMPRLVHDTFGVYTFGNAVGGSDGIKYYISMYGTMTDTTPPALGWTVFCYDTRYGVWHKEGHTQAINYAYCRGLWMLTSQGRIVAVGEQRLKSLNYVVAEYNNMVEFGDFTSDSPNKKITDKLLIRLELGGSGVTGVSSSLSVDVKFDDGEWQEIAKIGETMTDDPSARPLTYKAELDDKRSYYLSFITQRCDRYRIRLRGVGTWVLHSLTREETGGSPLKKH